MRLLGTRTLDELSIDLLAEQAGVSRGLLYHYFDTKQAFHEAVVRRAADALIAQTAPPAEGDPQQRLRASVAAYVDYVLANFAGYVSLIRGARGGNDALREIYEQVRGELGDRVFRSDPRGELVADSPQARLVVRGWLAYSEELVIAWADDAADGRAAVSRSELDALVAEALPGLVAAMPGRTARPEQAG